MAKTDIGPKISIDGEPQYRKQINNLIQQAKTLDSEMRAVTSAFNENTSAAEKAAAKSSVLNKQIDVQKQKIEQLRVMVEKSAGMYGETANETLKWKQKLNDATAALNNMEKDLRSASKQMDGLEDHTEESADQMERFERETKEAGNSLDKAGKSTTYFGEMLKSNLLSSAIIKGLDLFTDVLRAAGSAMFDFAKDGIALASDLEEVQNVVDTTFGDNALQIDQFAKSAAAGYGMSELSAKKFTGTMGAMLKSMQLTDAEVLSMSTSLVGLAGDMASFYNLESEEAFDKLRAGISGETEPLKQLGINMSVANLEAFALGEGITKAYKDMSQAEQATLRYNYVMQATADAQGDFVRTSDSYANQQRILALNIENISAAIGGKLLPYITQLTTATNKLISGNISGSEFAESIGETLTQAVGQLSGVLPALLDSGIALLTDLLTGVLGELPVLINKILPTVLNLLDTVLVDVLPLALTIALQLVQTLALGIAQAAPTLIPAAIDAVIALCDALVSPDGLAVILDAALALLIGLKDGIVAALPTLAEEAPRIVGLLATSIIQFLPELLPAAYDIVWALIQGIGAAYPQLAGNMLEMLWDLCNEILEIDWVGVGIEILSTVASGILGTAANLLDSVNKAFAPVIEWISKLLGQSPEWGRDMIDGMIKGIRSMISKVRDAAKSVANAISEWLHFSRPDVGPLKNYETWMPDMINGMVKGIEDNKYKLHNAVSGMAGDVALAASNGAHINNRSVNVGAPIINVYGRDGQSVDELADAVAYKLHNTVERREIAWA